MNNNRAGFEANSQSGRPALSVLHLWNGADFVPCAGVPFTDRGFRYGMSLFESLAVRSGGVEFLDAHLARLEEACRRCGWPVCSAALARAGEWLRALCGPAFARIYVTAGDGSPAGSVVTPRVFLFAEPRSMAAEQECCRAVCRPVPHLPVFAGFKTGNYWANLEAVAWARNSGVDEALLFNPEGNLISACMANVFVLRNGQWVTPDPASGARAGVAREWVLRKSSLGRVTQQALNRSDLSEATGCFLTNSWLGVLPVSILDGRRLDTAAGERLRAEFFAKNLRISA